SGGRDRDVGPLLSHLAACAGLEVSSDPSERPRPGIHHVMVALGEQVPGKSEAEDIAVFLRAGGGLVTLGETLGAWARQPVLATLLGWRPGEVTPRTERRLAPVPGSPLAPRMGAEVLLTDRVQLGHPPEEAEPLLSLAWRYDRRVVAFRAQVGEGRHV